MHIIEIPFFRTFNEITSRKIYFGQNRNFRPNRISQNFGQT